MRRPFEARLDCRHRSTFGAACIVALAARQIRNRSISDSADSVAFSAASLTAALLVGEEPHDCSSAPYSWGNSPAIAHQRRVMKSKIGCDPRSGQRSKEMSVELLPAVKVRTVLLCVVFVLLSASGPILFDWVKRAHGGRFPFSIPALTFHAWAIACLLGLSWTASQGREGLRQLNRPDMLWRFCITTSLFTSGDMLSFMSIQHLDVGTFSLVGKALAIIVTVFLSRVVLKKRQTGQQYALVGACAAATVLFCHSEVQARYVVAAGVTAAAKTAPILVARQKWLLGLVLRSVAVCLTSLGAVLQERLLTKQPGQPFLLQQVWMSCGAMAMSLFTFRCIHHLPFSQLIVGFDDWRVLLLLFMYVGSGLTTGLMVKRLGAVGKALCVPIYLGGCYFYAVRTGSAVFSAEAVLAWVTSTACILLYAVTKMRNKESWQRTAQAGRGVPLPK